MTKQHVRVELWHDFEEGGVHKQSYRPHAPYTRDQIVITRDRGDEQGDPVTGSAALTFPGHDLNPNNVASTLFGKVRQNTPLRVLAGSAAALEDTFSRSVTDGWGNLDTGQAWSLSGGTVPGNYDVNGFEGTHTHTTTNTYRISSVDTGSDDHLVRAIFDLSVSDVTGNPITAQIRGRSADPSNYYAVDAQYSTGEVVTITLSKRVAGVGAVISGSVAVPFTGGGSGGNDMIGELYVEGNRIYAKVWYRYVDEPLEWMVVAEDDDLTTGTSVSLAGRRETGNTNTDAQIRWHEFIAVPGTLRFAGECASFKPRRAVGAYEEGVDGVPVKGDRWVNVTANGPLRRIGQGEPPALSALWVENLGGDPVSMWPITDGADASQAASALPGGAPLSIQSLDFAAAPVSLDWEPVAYNSWVEPLATPALDTQLYMRGPVGMDSSLLEWAADFVFTASNDITALGGTLLFLTGTGTGTAADNRTDWIFGVRNGSYALIRRVYDGTPGGVDTEVSATAVAYEDGRVHHARLTTVRDGADVDWALWMDGVTIDSGTLAGSSWSTLVGAVGNVGAETTGQTSMGFITIWGTASPPFNAANAAVVGRSGELAADRLARLCLQNGLAFELIGTSADTTPMGPQPIATFVENVADIERTESGRVFESRHQPGLTMRTRHSLYAQTARFTADLDDNGVAPDLEPDVDDLGVVNDVTVVRTDGSSARAEDAASIARIGRRPRRFDINPEADESLPEHAGWRRNLHTQTATRYPQVTIDLVAAPSLVTATARTDSGDVFALDNAEPDQARPIVLGYTETIGTHTRQIAFNTGQSGGYDVFILDTDRLDHAGSTLANAETTTGTAWEPTTAAGSALWSTTSEPYDLTAAGERVTVTAMTGASSPQAATVTRSVNSVVKAQEAGATLQLANRRVLGL